MQKNSLKIVKQPGDTLLSFIIIPMMLLLSFQRLLPVFDVGGVTINLFVVYLFFVASVTIVRKVFLREQFGFGIVDLAISVMAFSFLFCMIFSDNIIHAGRISVHAIFVPSLIYATLKQIIRTDYVYFAVLKSVMWGYYFLSLSSIFNFLSTFSRPRPLGIHPIGAATLLFTGFAIAGLIFQQETIKRKISKILFFFGIVSLLARAYIVLLLVYQKLLELMKRGFAFWTIFFFMTISLLGTITIAYMPSVVAPEEDIRNDDEVGVFERLTNDDYWEYALMGRAFSYKEGLINFYKNKVWGIGIYRSERGMSVTRHNFHIEWLEYSGIVGYLSYLGVFLTYFWTIRNKAKSDSHIAVYSAAVLCILANSLTQGIMHGLMPHAVFMLMGLSASRIRIIANKTNN
ncbi:MAG: hypothetical protein K9L30_12775 [Desulfobacterales bacterium]|nr:hypothetical protein [Desulfobacterales bacterium]